jgi:DNA helicase HerA-like ATPase
MGALTDFVAARAKFSGNALQAIFPDKSKTMTLPQAIPSIDDISPLAPTDEPRTVGHVMSVRGSQASMGLPAESEDTPEEARVTVGKFLGVRSGKSLVVGLVANVATGTGTRRNLTRAWLDLIGEIRNYETSSAKFERGVSTYPAIGDRVTTVGSEELGLVFRNNCSRTIQVGKLQQDATIGAHLQVDEMLSKHFAVLGTTGVGKSSAVSLLLHRILEARSDLRVLLLDVHNEYGRCFGEQSLVLNPSNIKLPFWLYNFDEMVDVLFGGKPSNEEEVSILSECIPLAKSTYARHAAANGRVSIRAAEPGMRFTVDAPVPYRISDLVELLDGRMGKLENRSLRMVYHKLITRIETVCNDPRYAFMFENANVGGDTMGDIVSTLFRLPINGVPVTVLQLAGFPSEVVDAVVSVMLRMAFDLGLWSDGAHPLLVLCEEAHRYMAADHAIGFAPTRRSIARIAKEGRKYGVFLGLVSQRPAELDSTILSQCSTLFAMRMTNDRDQSLLRSAVADTAANFLAFLPSLGTGEAFAFGEGVALPTRLKFEQLPPKWLPRNETAGPGGNGDAADSDSITAILERWRGGRTIRQRVSIERTAEDVGQPKTATEQLISAHAQALDPLKLLKRRSTDKS